MISYIQAFVPAYNAVFKRYVTKGDDYEYQYTNPSLIGEMIEDIRDLIKNRKNGQSKKTDDNIDTGHPILNQYLRFTETRKIPGRDNEWVITNKGVR